MLRLMSCVLTLAARSVDTASVVSSAGVVNLVRKEFVPQYASDDAAREDEATPVAAHSYAPGSVYGAANYMRTEIARNRRRKMNLTSAIEVDFRAGDLDSIPRLGGTSQFHSYHQSDPFFIHNNGESNNTPVECGMAYHAPTDILCPDECPFLAEDRLMGCSFRCVEAEACGTKTLQPRESVPDDVKLECRECNVVACELCTPHKDECLECKEGFFLWEKKCVSNYWYVSRFIETIGCLLVFVLIAWLMELRFRPRINMQGLDHGEKFRIHTVRRMPSMSKGPHGPLYPLGTNTMKELDVGGPCFCLHMRFQLYLVLWSLALCVAFCCFAVSTDVALLKLGVSRGESNVDYCALVNWGKTRLDELKIDRLGFTFFAYIFTVGSSMLAAYLNVKAFQRLDAERVTVADFTARIDGLPITDGTERVEEELKTFLQESTGFSIVGVSVGWDFSEKEEAINQALEQQAEELERAMNPTWQLPLEKPPGASDAWNPCQEGGARHFRPVFNSIDNTIRVFLWGMPLEKERRILKGEIKEILEGLRTSVRSYAVFETEADRNHAVTMFDEKNLSFKGARLFLTKGNIEPEDLRWQNMSAQGHDDRAGRIVMLCFIVVAAIVVWTIVFYLPLAFYLTDKARVGMTVQTDMVCYMLLVGFVVVGNQLMYLVTDIGTLSYLRLPDESSRQNWYNILYTMAVLVMCTIDLMILAYLEYVQLCFKGVSTADGRKLSELTSFQDIMNSYPMQKQLGAMFYAYSCPGLFLLPYVLEGLFAIGLMGELSRLIVRSRPEMRGRKAEVAMNYFLEMNLCRYGDLVFSTSFSCFVVFVAPGFTHRTFLWAFAGNCYVFAYDQYRILRHTPKFNYSAIDPDRIAWVMMVLPSSILLGGIVFRGFEIYFPRMEMIHLVLIAIAIVVPVALLQVFVVGVIIPVSKSKHVVSHIPYADCAKTSPSNFFSLNPVFCLRSKHIYGHDVPCCSYLRGKEHLMWASPDLGTHFGKDAEEAKEFIAKANEFAAAQDVEAEAESTANGVATAPNADAAPGQGDDGPAAPPLGGDATAPG